MLLQGRLPARGVAASTAQRPRRVQTLRVATTEVAEASSNGTGPSIAKSSGFSSPPKFEPMENSFTELSDIIRLVHDTDIIEFELKSKKFNLVVRKKEALQAQEQVVQYLPAPTAGLAPAPATAAPAPAPVPAAAPAAPPAARPSGVEIGSPIAGTFYRSPAPGEPSFFKEGEKVKKGQTICIIEAMKLMNEIEAEVSGEIVKYLVENGSPVVPGQPIVLIKP